MIDPLDTESEVIRNLKIMYEPLQVILIKLSVNDEMEPIIEYSAALSVETGLTEETVKYLNARIKSLNTREKIGGLIMDEVYCDRRCEFSRSTGSFYGMEGVEPTKTLLTVMFKSVAAPYEDVIALCPMTKIDSSKLNEIFHMVIAAIEPIGYDVVCSLLDGHSSNRKFYQRVLCSNRLVTDLPHPADDNKKLFLLFDSVHIFKCMYNNLVNRRQFECPDWKGVKVSAIFHHIKELYEPELTKPVKMAFLLNDKCINPHPIEKSKVALADKVFSESTINAMTYYCANGYPQWKETLSFIALIKRWWTIVNVKSKIMHTLKRDPNRAPVTAENYKTMTFLEQFGSWLQDWENKKTLGFSKETFLTSKQTSKSLPLLAKYLIENKKLDYVLTGLIQSDPLEKRFGWYRQQCGGLFFPGRTSIFRC